MKFFRYLFIGLAGLLWLGGCSRSFMHELYQVGFIPDDYRFGDLYRLSSLPQFKERVTPCPPSPAFPDTARTDLYVLGDSFTEPGRLDKPDLPVHALHYLHWDHDLNRAVQLDPTRRNVLLIESVERHVRQHIATPPTQNLIVVSDSSGTNSSELSTHWGTELIGWIKSTGIEDRLETVLFSRDLFLWFRETKARLTLALFDRHSDKVVLSKDGRSIFSELEVTNPDNAAFTTLRATYVDSLVQNLNVAADHYRRAGFDDIVLSLIPNKVTLLEPDRGTYNHLIERIQQHPALRLTVVDVYTPYRQSPVPLYAKSDTHWNCDGRAIWLKAVRAGL